MIAWLAGQSKTHLCVASSIRAMPETEIPPATAGGYLFESFCFYPCQTNEKVKSRGKSEEKGNTRVITELESRERNVSQTQTDSA